MERQKGRKTNGEHKHSTYVTANPMLNQHESLSKKKNRNKYSSVHSSYPQQYDLGLNSCWPAPSRVHPFQQQRLFSTTSDPSVCHYSVPVSFALEPVSLPVYPALFQSPGNSSVPLETKPHIKRVKKYNKNKKRNVSHIDENLVPDLFHTPKPSDGSHQDYTSLPPVNYDINAKQLSDSEAASKRRFSDPGLGQLSDDCSSSSDDSIGSSTAENEYRDSFDLYEQINELKESNSRLLKELHETKLELESMKLMYESGRCAGGDLQPGKLSDAINEIHQAVKTREEALISKITLMFEQNSAQCKEVHRRLEDKLIDSDLNQRLRKIENQLQILMPDKGIDEVDDNAVDSVKDFSIRRQIVDLEQEKLQLRTELQEAISGRKKAEENTQKLERLVAILRKKINGVSLESCIPDDLQTLVRPVSYNFEQNPFIIANCKNNQKTHSLPFVKRSSASKSDEKSSTETETTTTTESSNNRENEITESGTSGTSTTTNSSSSCTPAQTPTEGASLSAQVTITGPVTDL